MSNPRTRWLLGALLLAALIALLVMVTPAIVSPSTAVAQEADYCGVQGFNVPDSIPGVFDFSGDTGACADHDVCYTNGGPEGKHRRHRNGPRRVRSGLPVRHEGLL